MDSKIELYSLATPNGMKVDLHSGVSVDDAFQICLPHSNQAIFRRSSPERLIDEGDLSLAHLDLKVSVALEEMGFDYNPHTIHIGKNEQFTPEFIAINPNSKIPAITDPNGPDGKPIHVFESGAILLYLAEKTGKFIFSHDPRLKWETIQWVFFQMAGVGPMFGQFGHFFKYGKKACNHPYPLERYSTEVKRLLGVLEKKLDGQEFLVGNEYSIADMATFPWVHCLDFGYQATEYLGLSNFPNVVAWKSRCMERPATAKGLTICPFS